MLSAPVLNAANDNSQGGPLPVVDELADSVTFVRPEPRRAWGGVAIIVCATAAVACVGGWLYIVSTALLDNLSSLIR